MYAAWKLPDRSVCGQHMHAQGHRASRTLVGELLNARGYSLQANRKTKEGDSHPDRDAQFAHINNQVTAALAETQPVITIFDQGTRSSGALWRL